MLTMEVSPRTVDNIKVNLRIINDTKVQNLNKEEDVLVGEAAKSDPGTVNFQSDRCKLFSESNVIADNFIHHGQDIDAVYSI